MSDAPVLRITRFTAEPEVAEELVSRYAALVDAVRAVCPGPSDARLARLDERTWISVWTYADAADAEATTLAAPSLPESAAAFALASDPTSETAGLIDSR